MANIKKRIQSILETNDLEAIAGMMEQDKKVLPCLVRLSYNKETLIAWRAIKAIGLAARELVKTDPAFLRETCRKLLWSLSDESGGIGWSAPEILGEIISADPRGFAEFIPLVASVYDIEEPTFRPGIVYALGRIAETAPQLAISYQKIVISSLVAPDPAVRAYALMLIEKLWEEASRDGGWSSDYRKRILGVVKRLHEDQGETWVYRDPEFVNVHIGELAVNMSKKIK